MDVIPKLKMLCTDYLDEAKALDANNNEYVSLLKRIFGIRSNPGDKELNPEFYGAAAACLEEFRSEPHTAEDALAVAEYMLHTSAENSCSSVAGLTMVAVQGLVTPLVPSLPPKKAAELADWYKKQYPRQKRFPIQEDLLKALKARSK